MDASFWQGMFLGIGILALASAIAEWWLSQDRPDDRRRVLASLRRVKARWGRHAGR